MRRGAPPLERNYALATAVIVAIILYGSFYPFIYYAHDDAPGGAVAAFLASWQEAPSSRGDVLANIALYLPYGFFAVLALSRRWGATGRVTLTVLFAAALSLGVELAQFHVLTRVTSVYDMLDNSLGALFGAVAGLLLGGNVRWPLLRDMARSPVPTLLLAAFYLYRLFPYEPVIDLHKYWRAIRAAIEAPELPPGELARRVVIWLLVCLLAEAIFGRRRALLILPLLIAAEFLGKILIVENLLATPDLAGGVLALLLWVALLSWLPGRSALIALAFGALVIVDRLAPFDFQRTAHDFGLVPFVSLIAGSPAANMVAFLEKFFQYGGLIWLLTRAGTGLPIAATVVATLLFVTSLAETFLLGRSASVTDAAMALAIALIFGLIASARPHGRAA
jgi:VanZ family protein